MNDTTRKNLADEANALAARVAERLAAKDRHGQTVLDRMRDAQVGHLRSPSFEAGTGPARLEDLSDELRGKTNYSDPTGTAGVQVAQQGDQAARRLAEADKRLKRIVTDLAVVDIIFGDYMPRTANTIEQQETGEPDPGCESCARVPSPGTVGFAKRDQTPWWNPVDRSATIDGKPWALCRWCYDGSTLCSYRFTGKLPDIADIEARRDTGKPRKRSA